MKYWMIDPLTKEVIGEYDAQSKWNVPRNAMIEQPLPPKQGFAVVAVFDESGKAIDSEYVEDHRGATIYDESDCTKSIVVSELGRIKVGFTTDKPLTEFDERINGAWVTNESNKYIAEYNAVDTRRREIYTTVINPLELEALRKERAGESELANEYFKQADAATEEMKQAHPFPEPPQT
ncbi:hypothetical protein [Vibrio aquimaris]|uniref:Uncharacterized protein n=1 Tax=Vibrio aquimaris TaxID=2587862 RepID=A0A5P9CS60_9VIBR|nr:hypothetical protein [Vibrio aquimaris]QFT28793.1 hypothetical protein FIV01_20540 [Vibrio aquimaris]